MAGTAGTDLTGWSVVHYNGNGGGVIGTINLIGTIDDEGSGFGALNFTGEPVDSKNGNDGFALVDPLGTVVEFISYEGSFTASGGPADGLTAVDVGVNETNGTAAGIFAAAIQQHAAFGSRHVGWAVCGEPW